MLAVALEAEVDAYVAASPTSVTSWANPGSTSPVAWGCEMARCTAGLPAPPPGCSADADT